MIFATRDKSRVLIGTLPALVIAALSSACDSEAVKLLPDEQSVSFVTDDSANRIADPAMQDTTVPVDNSTLTTMVAVQNNVPELSAARTDNTGINSTAPLVLPDDQSTLPDNVAEAVSQNEPADADKPPESAEAVAQDPKDDSSSDTVTTTQDIAPEHRITYSAPRYRPNSVFKPDPTDIGDHDAMYTTDGYASDNVIRLDVRIANTRQGTCNFDDQSGCTLADVLADVDNKDDFKVEIPVHVSGDDLPDDGLINNATIRQRGNTARQGAQKSFRLKLDSKQVLWRNERRLQLNKNPFEPTRFKNKLSFDLFQAVPHFPSLRSQFVNLWIDNGEGPEDYGVFTHTEFVGREYVLNRRLNENDNLYKINHFQFFPSEAPNLKVNDKGKPLSKNAFENHLEIKNGKDHRAVMQMMDAMQDPARTFDSVLDQHFNRNNVLTWLATNLILRQADAITHNFYLYNPAGTERFYFLPWDYDGTFEIEQKLTDSTDNAELQKRKYFGYARGLSSRFVNRWYRQPGAHQLLVSAIDELRGSYFSDEQILQRATTLNNLLEPYLRRLPDSEHMPFKSRSAQRMVESIRQNYIDITTGYDYPMEPTVVANPQVDAAGKLQLRWTPAFDVVGNSTLSYDLTISTNSRFYDEDIVFSDNGIANVKTGLVGYAVDAASLPSGRVFVRVIARASKDPDKYWQTNSNIHRRSDGTTLFGMLKVIIP